MNIVCLRFFIPATELCFLDYDRPYLNYILLVLLPSTADGSVREKCHSELERMAKLGKGYIMKR